MTGVTPLGRQFVNRVGPPLVTVVLTAAAAVIVTWPLARHMGRAALREGEVLLAAVVR